MRLKTWTQIFGVGTLVLFKKKGKKKNNKEVLFKKKGRQKEKAKRKE